jgi:integrase
VGDRGVGRSLVLSASEGRAIALATTEVFVGDPDQHRPRDRNRQRPSARRLERPDRTARCRAVTIALDPSHSRPDGCGRRELGQDDGSVNHRPQEDVMESLPLLDRAGRRRSPATHSSFHRGVPPRNKGLRYPPDPPTVEEIIAVMRAAGDSADGLRLRGLIVVLWRAGLRVSEALALAESDLDAGRGAILVRQGKGDKRREVGMDRWGKRRDKPAWRRR